MNGQYLTARVLGILAFVLASCTASAVIAQTPPRPKVEMWFSPNLVADTKNNKPSILDSANIPLWNQTYLGVAVFGSYRVDLGLKYNTNAASNMISTMKTDGKKISVEVGGMSMALCYPSLANARTPLNWDFNLGIPKQQGTEAANDEGPAISTAMGQRVDYLILDGPFERAFDQDSYSSVLNACAGKFTKEFIARELVSYMQQMKKRFPNVKFLLGTNFAHWNYTTPGGTLIESTTGHGSNMKVSGGGVLDYRDVLNTIVPLANAGSVPLTGVVIDTPYNYIINELVGAGATAGLAAPSVVESRWSRISGLVDQAHTKGLKAYIFTNSEQFPSSPTPPDSEIASKSAAFHDGSVAYSLALNSRNIPLDGHIVASWYNNPVGWFINPKDTAATVPGALLPDAEANTFANTARDILFNINAYNEPVFGVIGYIDGLAGPGKGYLGGWACGQYLDSSISIHLYIGGPAGQGQFAGAYTANITSEPGVASICKTGASNYRFGIPVANRFPVGTALYVYAISPSGGQSKLLINSGNFSSP